MQCYNIFEVQGVTDDATRIHYAITGFEEAALHWYLRQVRDNDRLCPYIIWDLFRRAVQQAFLPPNYHH